MQKKRRWLSIHLAGAVALAAPSLCPAAGFGAGSSGAVLGRPLDFSVQIRLDPGQALESRCVGADVMLGERRLHPSGIHTSVEATGVDRARIRITTTQAVDEPVVTVQVTSRCGGGLERRFVVLADPAPDAPSAPAYAQAPPPVPPPPPVETAPPTRTAAAESITSSGPEVPPSPRAVAAPRRAAATSASRHRAATHHRAGARPRTAPARRRTVAAAVPVVAAAAARSTPRLQLELSEPQPDAAASVDLALQAVADAASAARASAVAASAAAQRITDLETTVAQMRVESRQNQALNAELRERLRRAEAGSGRWFWPLLVVLAMLGAVVIWLGLRLSALQRRQQEDWRAQAAAMAPKSDATAGKQVTSPIPFVTTEVPLVKPASTTRPRPGPAWPPPAPPEPWTPPKKAMAPVPPPLIAPDTEPPALPEPAMQRTMLLPPRVDESAPRDVSIEELLDLEQQAEFFVVLGQDEAAIDLLVDHLRQTGGGSPLPYLKLLEIYRRRGQRDEYERTRGRFNQRFNAYAPDWDVDLQAGRSLEDYAGVIPRLQQLWPRPLDSMAELEALLFRKSRGELFDLPAYREVLFLYSLARDLLDRETPDAGHVDLLLPLGSADHRGPGEDDDDATVPGRRHLNTDGEPTAPVDLDLSLDTDRPTSIFDRLEDTQPFRRGS
ncbi:MAG: hypothetical protein KGN16_01380 [Burkholderiales bacterium]|nr:hypothetical protein [Burkholderiales bacterium]